MYYDDSIHIEEDDQCYTCQHFLKGVSCPLLEALALGVAELTGEVVVRNCGFYIKFERHLKVIRENTDPGDSDEEPSPTENNEEVLPPDESRLPKKVN